MDQISYNKQFFDFLERCPTPFHVTEYLAKELRQAGLSLLIERDEWNLEAGKGYYCIRDDGSIIGLRLAKDSPESAPWRMTGSHTDSPSLQIKPQPLREGHTLGQLGVEIYGGPLLNTWFDRDLGIAGRVSILDQKGTLLYRTIDFKRPMAIIPSLAIHLDRNANKDHTVAKQKHLYPLYCHSLEKEGDFQDTLLEQITREYPDIAIQSLLGFDLFCYDTQPPALIGLGQEFIAAGRLDNLVSCFATHKALLLQEDPADNCLFLCSNHEEIGSSTIAGAQGNFLSTVLERLNPNTAQRNRVLHSSYFISLDNAHALHPNFIEKHDPQHLPLLNHGPVIKYNSNQRYATTSRSAALYQTLCREIDIPLQTFVMHNDLACGSTIGPIAATRLGVQTVDIGVPSLAMHSIRETTGTKDPHMLYQSIAHFYARPQLPDSEA